MKGGGAAGGLKTSNIFFCSPPQSYKGNPFDDLDDMNSSEDDDVENRELNDLDSSYLVMK